jgi:MoaA/NifB/PqqE/SkfB family radical SAM enzyme
MSSFCKAPSNNMYFTVKGYVSPCWKTTVACDNWSEDRSIMDIWSGDKFQMYRDALAKNVFLNRCTECKVDVDNEVWPLARAYEKLPVHEYPSLMELELSNQCNLECTMCSGLLSSGIRKNRDKLPPLKQIYTDKFVEELREFIPHLQELRFNGGEPFAQKIVLDICDMVTEVNPKLKIRVATNGTVYTKRVKHILANNNIHLNISIDSLQQQRYEEIRINADFKKLMINFDIFHKYSKDNNRSLVVLINPMRNNWEEMVDFIWFTDKFDISLWYNTILYPTHLAIHSMQAEDLDIVYNTMLAQLQELPSNVRNYDKFKHLVSNQIGNWYLDKLVDKK